jgi:isocitrate dehydrogenase
VIGNLEQKPSVLPVASEVSGVRRQALGMPATDNRQPATKSLIGFDLFIDWQEEFDELLAMLKQMESEKLEVKMISAKGLLLWPLIDKHMMPNYLKGLTVLRFIGKGITGKSSNEIIDASKSISHQDIIEMLVVLEQKKIDFVKYEGLYLFDGAPGYTSGQGE